MHGVYVMYVQELHGNKQIIMKMKELLSKRYPLLNKFFIIVDANQKNIKYCLYIYTLFIPFVCLYLLQLHYTLINPFG